ncbi:DMT family transporter [Patescibacteria group bacterium]|nr:DMT family transporter [Patescibacteria group bacterium]
MTKTKKGVYFALSTALISGFAVFLNKFALSEFANSNIFTTEKNIVVALIFCALILTPKAIKTLKTLTRKDWLQLFLIGIIGGSVPFLLFFKGLSMASSSGAAFIHKTLFIWIAILAVPFLKEKLSKIQLAALGVLLLGNILLGGIKSFSVGQAELLIFLATILWAIEFVLAKKLLFRLDTKIISWARMFFGAIILIAYLVFTQQANLLFDFSYSQVSWIAIASALLFLYVFTWYGALKILPATIVSGILVIASPITTLLNNIFILHKYSADQILGSLIICLSIFLFVYSNLKIKKNELSASPTI